MPGPKPKNVIQLLDNQIAALQCLIRSHKAAQAQVMRAKIVLAAYEHPEWSNQQIAHKVGCTDRIVRKWRRRWVETHCLEDLPRPGAPKHFSP
jgi:transposase